jgi:type IV secretory pathway VirB2 component (pilin)
VSKEEKIIRLALLMLLSSGVLLAQGPWEISTGVLSTSFEGPIARSLSLLAIIVGGLVFAYSEGAGKRMLAGIVAGLGMALGARSWRDWLFPY